MQYIGIRSEGGLIPYDILDSIANEEAGLGQQAKDFGLAAGRRLTDEIARAWSDAQDYWHIFQRRGTSLPESETGTTLTRKWVTDLLNDLLGYDLAYQPSGAVILGKNYPISHRAGAGEESPPVHVEGLRSDLDRRPPGRRLSPQALVQEYLNNSEGHLWGIVTNGVLLRLLRDTSRTSRPTYLEFDLQSILDGNRFNEFALFYRVCHRSRLPKTAEDSTSCWLEKYFQLSIEQGGRVREKLRVGVEDALKVLGTGLLRHPNNTALRERVKSGALSPAEFHRQLLRLVYRLLFLMVAEERQMIVPESGVAEAPDSDRRQRLYDTYYSVGRLRGLAEKYIEPSTFGDLWIGLQQTFALFEDGADSNPLGIPPLNGDLFSATALPDIRMRFDHKGDPLGPFLYNADLLKAMYWLSLFEEKRVLQRVNYRDLDVEELGSVYESLLDYQPVFINEADATRFDLLAGSERKSTGSYYTRPELVRELIESALVPVMQDRLSAARDADPEKQREKQQQAILSMSVCDPACGSGHFLLAAARRLGRELAKIRTGEDEPTPREFHLAVREVIAHCIYGVDLNPLAVDLCKLALWLEGHWTGKPLSFLDHRIKCGNSLIGVLDPKVLREGIPDDAFKPVTGDVKAAASAYKRENKEARKRLERSRDQGRLRFDAGEHLHALATGVQEINSLAEDVPADVRQKAQRYAALRAGGDFNQELLASHLWSAAFFAELKQEGDQRVPTTEELERCLEKLPVNGNTLSYAFDLAQQLRFFHWRLEFPEVFEKGGFDVVLGNPPFMGGLKVSGSFGERYRRWLEIAFAPFGGTADLCAAFYRRVFAILRRGGRMGMVATNTIGQGDTRESGLAVMLRSGGRITFARRFVKWPGAANVEVNLVAIHKADTAAPAVRQIPILDGRAADFISSRLDSEPEAEPQRLPQNEGESFQGDIVRGIGFVLEPAEAEQLLTKDPRNADCLLPYLNGEDLNSHPEQKPSRWVICFHDWELARAKQYPELLAIVEERVRPEREKLHGPGDKRNRKYWWQFAAYRAGMRLAVGRLQRVLVRSRVSELHAMVFVAQGWVYNEQLVVFAFDDDYHFALLQSNVHEAWLRRQASSLRTDIRYTPTDCFDTFPFPAAELPAPALETLLQQGTFQTAAHLGKECHEHRRQTMLARNLGLTKTYNLFHNPGIEDADICRLRELHAEMDRAILACYAWQDLDPGHSFYPNDRGQTRFTVSPAARREILRRLLELNLTVAREAAEDDASPLQK